MITQSEKKNNTTPTMTTAKTKATTTAATTTTDQPQAVWAPADRVPSLHQLQSPMFASGKGGYSSKYKDFCSKEFDGIYNQKYFFLIQ